MFAWCGPQPNSRLLLNYGIVDEQNPNDKMVITATIPNNDPLFPQKRYLLQQHNMATQQSFQLQRHHVSVQIMLRCVALHDRPHLLMNLLSWGRMGLLQQHNMATQQSFQLQRHHVTAAVTLFCMMTYSHPDPCIHSLVIVVWQLSNICLMMILCSAANSWHCMT